MKLKKIFAGVLAGIIALTSTVMSVSAATLTLTFSNALSTCYAIKITARASSANINFENGDTIAISPYAGMSLSLTGGSRSAYGKVTDTTFMGDKLTQGLVTCALFGGENKFVPGYTNVFEWTGVVTLNDNTLHPVTDLGLSLSSSNLVTVQMTINAKSLTNPVTHTLPVVSAEVITVPNSNTILSGSTLYVKDYINNGLGLSTDEKAKLKNGTDFRLTANLSESLASTTMFILRTSLDTSGITAYGYKGDRSVVFDKLPLGMFYDKTTSEKFSTDILFEYLVLIGGYSYSGLTLTFTDNGAAASTTTTPSTTAATTTGSSATGVYDEEEEEDYASSNYINYPVITLNPGASAYLTTNIEETGLKRTTTSRNICRVFTSGRILAVNPGVATITITNSKGQKVTCTVTVKNSSSPVSSYSLSTKSGVIYKGNSYSLSKHTKSPSTTTDTINWSTSDPTIATVTQSGKVTVVGTGIVEITALASSGVSSTATLTARNPYITVSSGTSKSIRAGATHTIKTKVGPSSSKLTYSSSSSSIAKVSSTGVVTGVKKGTATITIKSNKGPTATVKITVT